MRSARKSDLALQCGVAALLLCPLLIAFLSTSPFESAAPDTQDPAVNAAHRVTLAWSFGRSMLIGVSSALLAMVFGIPAALALCQKKKQLWLLVVIILPLVLPASVIVSGWVGLAAPANAASRFKVPIPGFGPESRGWLFSPLGVIVVLGTSLWPILALELWPGLQRARNESYDAAILNSSRTRAFFKILLPQVKAELFCGLLLVFLLAASDFSVSSLLLVRSLPIEVHDELMLGNTRAAAFASLPLIVTVVLLSLIFAWLQKHTAVNAPILAESSSAPQTRAPRALTFAGIALGFGMPILVCLLKALNAGKPMNSVFGVGADSLLVTMRLAGAAALIAIFIGILRLIVWPETRTLSVNTAGLFLLAIPGSFLAAALLAIQLKVTPWADRMDASIGQHLLILLPAAILALGYVVRFIYIPLRLTEEGLASLDEDLLNAAALAGHGRLSRAISVALPLVLPHLAAAGALVFILAMGEIPMAAKLAPPGVTPATIWLFQQQHYGYDEAVFGLSLLLGMAAAVALGFAGTVAWLLLKLNDRSRSLTV